MTEVRVSRGIYYRVARPMPPIIDLVQVDHLPPAVVKLRNPHRCDECGVLFRRGKVKVRRNGRRLCDSCATETARRSKWI